VIIAGRCSTSWRVISQDRPLVADHDPGAQDRHRDAALAEQPFDLSPAAQVR
jgi:hypothetical protein